MRILALLLPLALAIGCHRHDHERPNDPAWTAPPAASNGRISVRVVSIERRDDHIAARLRLENLTDAPIGLKNLGDTLTGFRAQVEGRTFNADAYRHDDQQVTAARIGELPALTPLELDLRWSIRPELGTNQYDCAIIVGNLFQADKKLPDITIEIPGVAPGEPERPEAKPPEKKRKSADAKPAGDKVAL